MAETLKPCPFCRNEALMDESGYKYLDGAHAMYGYSAILPQLRRGVVGE